jgi:putative tricarboxylic transport membrane protein
MPSPRSSLVSADTVAGSVIAILGIGWTVMATNIPPDPSQSSVIGPAVFPVLLGVLLTVGALALVATSMLKARAGRAPVGVAAPAAPPPAPAAAVPGTPEVASRSARRRSFWVLMALLAGYVYLFLPLGYLLSTATFLMALMTYLNPRRVTVNLLFAVFLPVAVYLLFGFALRITLPAGVLSGVLP